jgi:hypothetical protein
MVRASLGVRIEPYTVWPCTAAAALYGCCRWCLLYPPTRPALLHRRGSCWVVLGGGCVYVWGGGGRVAPQQDTGRMCLCEGRVWEGEQGCAAP